MSEGFTVTQPGRDALKVMLSVYLFVQWAAHLILPQRTELDASDTRQQLETHSRVHFQ